MSLVPKNNSAGHSFGPAVRSVPREQYTVACIYLYTKRDCYTIYNMVVFMLQI